MKILFITNLYPPHYVGGYELHCAVVAEGLRQRGHEVSVLTSNHGVDEGHVDQSPKVERSLRIHGHFGHPWLGIQALTQLELHNNRVLRDAVDKQKPDLVYVWNLGGLSKSMLLTLERLELPVGIYVSDHWIARSLKADVWLNWWNRSSKTTPAGALGTLYDKLGWRARWDRTAPTAPSESIQFRSIAFCSRAMRTLTEISGYEVGHASIIHCPINITKYTGEAATADRPMKKLLYAGRFAEDKGVLTTLKAMALVKGKFDGVLHLYGKGEPEYVTMLQDYAAKESLPVKFLSAEPDEMPEVYRNHDALLFPSEWEEPFALSPLEAMACGLPVIATMTGGSAELFRHEVNALTYDAGDATMLASRILEFAANPVLRHEIATRGQSDVRTLCAENAILDQQDAFVRKTVAGWSRQPASDVAIHPDLLSAVA